VGNFYTGKGQKMKVKNVPNHLRSERIAGLRTQAEVGENKKE